MNIMYKQNVLNLFLYGTICLNAEATYYFSEDHSLFILAYFMMAISHEDCVVYVNKNDTSDFLLKAQAYSGCTLLVSGDYPIIDTVLLRDINLVGLGNTNFYPSDDFVGSSILNFDESVKMFNLSIFYGNNENLFSLYYYSKVNLLWDVKLCFNNFCCFPDIDIPVRKVPKNKNDRKQKRRRQASSCDYKVKWIYQYNGPLVLPRGYGNSDFNQDDRPPRKPSRDDKRPVYDDAKEDTYQQIMKIIRKLRKERNNDEYVREIDKLMNNSTPNDRDRLKENDDFNHWNNIYHFIN